MNLVIKTLRYQIDYGFVETFSFRLRLYDDLSYIFFLLTFLRMRFQFLIHFSGSFKFFNTILSFYCGFVIGFVHLCSMCSSYIRFVWYFVVYFMFLLACFTLRLEISSRFPWQFNILVANYSFLLCFVSYF